MGQEGDDGRERYRQRFVRTFLDFVALTILRGKPSYGYEVISLINEKFGVYVSPGSLYPVLYNLERAGLVTGTWEQPDRRTRKVYALTLAGEQALRERLGVLERMLAALERHGERNAQRTGSMDAK